MPDLTPILVNPDEKRRAIRARVVEGLQESFPIKSRNKTLEVEDVQVVEKDYSPSEQKKAILRGDTLHEAVKGTVRLKDQDGKVVDEVKNFTLARVPWFTPRHTFVVGGNEYSVSNMVRPKPGVYARKRANEILEANFNVVGGQNFNVTMDPEKGEPQLEYGSSKIPLYTVLRKAGVPHERIAKVWGRKLAEQNHDKLSRNASKHVDKLYKKVIPTYRQKGDLPPEEKMKEVLRRYSEARMDPDVNRATLGKGYDTISEDSLLDASGKVLRIFREADEVDDRDNLDFKTFHGVEDFFKERIKLHSREVARKAAIKMEATPELRKAIASGPFTSDILKFINSSQLASVPTQTNPMELIDAAVRVTSLGEGGISSERAIPMEARNIHPTQIGALDPIRTPESFRAGIDVRAAMMAKRDAKGNIYVPLYDVKKKKPRYVRAGEIQRKVIAFPNQKMTGRVAALEKGVMRKVPVSKVDYQIPHVSALYSPATNLVPFLESAQGNRAVMGSKMQVQALSLVDREAPYVQVKSQTGRSFERLMGDIINPHAPVSGTVAKVDDDFIYIRPDKEKTAARGGALVKVPYEKDFPLAAKTYLDHDITVKKGDKVRKGQVLGESNFSRNGTLSLGKNLRVAYMPYYGANSNDAVVVSARGAKKMTSERMYKIIVTRDNDLTFDREKHRTYYGHSYTKDQYQHIDKEGVITPGTTVHPGDPVVIGLRKSEMTADDLILGKLHRSLARPFREFSQKWDHDHAGEVVDVVKTPKRIALTIKTKEPAGIGDKLAGRYGNKGVISRIIPDDQMIQDEAGKPIDLIMTSAGVVSRVNPSQIIETAVGKVAEKTGKPVLVENFEDRDNVKWAKGLLKKHGLKDKETVFDPLTGKKIPGVFVGRQYIMKLFKSTDTNYGARGLGSYDVNQQPTKGGAQSAKTLGRMEVDALIGHNARNMLREATTIKSQKSDEYWRALQLGYPTPPAKTTFAADKFLNMLTGAGIKVNRDKHILSLAPLTDDDVTKMSAGEIKEPKLVRAKDLRPESGGLFDPALTGGMQGTKWSHIRLAEPIVNPVFVDPVRRLLGMTQSQLNTTLKEKGAKHIKRELAGIDINRKLRELKVSMKRKSGSQLDNELKQAKYLRALKEMGLTPDKAYIVSKVPVVPPVVRPILPGKGGQELMYGDINPLYRDLLYVNNQFRDVKKSKLLPDEEKSLRPALQEAVGAVYGTNDPVTSKSKMRGHKGFLTAIAGTTPKLGYFQSKLVSKTQDVSGRGTIVPDVTLGLDEVGIPEDMLWSMYEKFLVKDLVSKGYRALQAKEMVEDRHPGAREALMREIQRRPVVLNRAPTLHRYNMIGAFPKPVPGKTIRINPFLEPGMNADYDGDSMNIHVPVTEGAIEDANNMTLSSVLFSDKNRDSLLVFPEMESIMGLAHATEVDAKNKTVRKFKSKADAMKAYNAGRIGLGTRVQIGSK
jgi:DNA-directed RNA polymerase beta subunit